MRPVAYSLAALVAVAGIFWAGRESTHGLSAFWEHWWCPVPIVAIVLSLAAVLLLARSSNQGF